MNPKADRRRHTAKARFPAVSRRKMRQGARLACEFKAVRCVEFSETDMAGIVHYSNYFKYMETAEQGFFRSLGCSTLMDNVGTPVGWPRVHAECDYRHPLRFGDEVEIHLLVRKKKSKAITYLFKFTKLNGPGRIEVARGSLTVVCVTRRADGSFKAVRMPKKLSAKIEAAPRSLLE
jgi:acyl-CoA thioester hydrolase